jgi:bis(5'-nucleosyl)-tetraphosphatase (symmetrical)
VAVYAIGDVQGCFGSLHKLLDRIRFDPGADRLWLTGDLVNRGPESLEVLRFVRDLGDRAICVLGNHDLHLLAVARGHAEPKARDTLGPILRAPDRDELIEWLRRRPLLHYDSGLATGLIHAGLLPQWTLGGALDLASEVQDVLCSSQVDDFLSEMYGDRPDRWDPGLKGIDRWRVVVNALTRLRYCNEQGRMVLDVKCAPGGQPAGLVPWFRAPGRASGDVHWVFGHWSTLGLWEGDGVTGLDSGCLWGGELSALRLEGGRREVTKVTCPQTQRPHISGVTRGG